MLMLLQKLLKIKQHLDRKSIFVQQRRLLLRWLNGKIGILAQMGISLTAPITLKYYHLRGWKR